jgi:CRP-like cAMP-binding protein
MEQRQRHAGTLLRMASSSGDEAALLHFARQIHGLLGGEAEQVARAKQWSRAIKAHHEVERAVREALVGRPPQGEDRPGVALATFTLRDAISSASPPAAVYTKLAGDSDPIISGVATLALAEFNPAQAITLLGSTMRQFEGAPWLLQEISSILQSAPVDQRPQSAGAGFEVMAASTITKLGWLIGVELFEEMPLSALTEVARQGELRRYPKGATICHEGERSDCMFLILSGSAEVFQGGNGARTPVGRIVSGQAVGEMGVFTRKPRAATVVADSAAAEVLAFAEEYLDQVWDNPHASRGILMRVADYYQMARSQDETSGFAPGAPMPAAAD